MHIQRLEGYAAALVVAGTAAIAQPAGDGTLVQYGTMREAIGHQKSEGRVHLSEIVAKPHFYGIAALEGLGGEITVFDSSPTVTRVGAGRALSAVDGGDLQATLLAGAYVPSWRAHTIDNAIPAGEEFDDAVRTAASDAGVDTSKPFVFTADGEFHDVRLHVINGACPLHARLHDSEIPDAQKPFEAEFATLRGRIVGIYAEDAVGKLTHPDTSTHVHVIFQDEASGEIVTGHVERIGLPARATLNVPRVQP